MTVAVGAIGALGAQQRVTPMGRGKLLGRVRTGQAKCFRTVSAKRGLVERHGAVAFSVPASEYASVMDALGYSAADVASGLTVKEGATEDTFRIGGESYAVAVANSGRARKAFLRCCNGAGLEPIPCMHRGEQLCTDMDGGFLADTVCWYWFRTRDHEAVRMFSLTCRFVLRTVCRRHAVHSGTNQFTRLDPAVAAKRRTERRRRGNEAAGPGFEHLGDERRIACWTRSYRAEQAGIREVHVTHTVKERRDTSRERVRQQTVNGKIVN
jgi:hypothetical protein